ncbi:MAG: hypothetical protein KAJ24_00540, partial [Candidatus Aenigmarchaeota archaeon]|nr:hypothetical protein [Candidatus Aenigmarchaeota archaeon]
TRAINMKAYDTDTDQVMEELIFNASFSTDFMVLVYMIAGGYAESGVSGDLAGDGVVVNITEVNVTNITVVCPEGYIWDVLGEFGEPNQCNLYISPQSRLEELLSDILDAIKDVLRWSTEPINISSPKDLLNWAKEPINFSIAADLRNISTEPVTNSTKELLAWAKEPINLTGAEDVINWSVEPIVWQVDSQTSYNTHISPILIALVILVAWFFNDGQRRDKALKYANGVIPRG